MRDLEPFGVNHPDQGIAPRHVRRATRRQSETEYAIYCRQLEVDKLVEFERQDVEATTEACEIGLAAEFGFVDTARQEAQGEPIKREMATRKIAFLSATNNSRARRRFGRLG